MTRRHALAVTIRPPLRGASKCGDGALDFADASRTSTGLTSTAKDGAAAWTAANWPIPEAMAGSRRTAARLTLGAICFSSSSHLPLRPYSNE